MRKLSILLLFVCILSQGVLAQSGTVTLTSAAEVDIGFDCPVAQAFTPDNTEIWVLMQGCFSREYNLVAYHVEDGSPVDIPVDYTDALVSLKNDISILSWINPMAFTDENTIRIAYSDNSTFELGTVTVSLDGTEGTPILSDDELNSFLLTYAEYVETAIYNVDHTRVAIAGYDALSVLDLTTQEAILSLPLEPDSYNAFPAFSADGSTLYVARIDDPDSTEVLDATLFFYSLPDGELLGSYPIPDISFYVSPDEQYVAVIRGSFDSTTSDLFVIDLTTGATSEPFSLYEASRPVSECLNDGRNMSDLDMRTDGRLSMEGLNWLPDSSGFWVTRSYGGPTLSGSPCAFDYSRLNRFDVTSS